MYLAISYTYSCVRSEPREVPRRNTASRRHLFCFLSFFQPVWFDIVTSLKPGCSFRSSSLAIAVTEKATLVQSIPGLGSGSTPELPFELPP